MAYTTSNYIKEECKADLKTLDLEHQYYIQHCTRTPFEQQIIIQLQYFLFSRFDKKLTSSLSTSKLDWWSCRLDLRMLHWSLRPCSCSVNCSSTLLDCNEHLQMYQVGIFDFIIKHKLKEQLKHQLPAEYSTTLIWYDF